MGTGYFSKIEEQFMDRRIIKRFGWTKKEMNRYLRNKKFREKTAKLSTDQTITCEKILDSCRDVLDLISPEPEGGWLEFLFRDGKHMLYPDNFPKVMEPVYEDGKKFFLHLLRFWIHIEQDLRGFEPTLHYQLVTDEERQDCQMKEEYERFLDFCDETWFLEFMRIASEITPFNTNGHIAGVHHVAMVMARQLKKAGSPVDLSLMSAAAIGHDIGKFGCKDKEARRVPYLHYYYTDQCLQRYHMPGISYIAANHSTWDLELENLSLESLLLIYSDFRVKSTRENGKEQIHFYTLADSFDVILSKLDNVDDAKKKRYRKVYSKLVDFEQYMKQLGCHTEFEDLPLTPPAHKDSALLTGAEVIDAFKHAAVRHNVEVMHILNSEYSFMNILEEARSEKDWKNTRTYLNIFREYSTYMNQRQKLLTMDFLYELLMHYESDIRGSACELMAYMIAGFDVEYRKEIPDGMSISLQNMNSIELFRRFYHLLLNPDHKLTEQHRRWLGFKLEALCFYVLTYAKPSRRREYMNVIMTSYRNSDWDDMDAFYLLHTMNNIPVEDVTEEDQTLLLNFCLTYMERNNVEVQVSILRYILKLVQEQTDPSYIKNYAEQILAKITNEKILAIHYLRYMISQILGIPHSTLSIEDIQRLVNVAFLENLKSATPWICKVVNIQFLTDEVLLGNNRQLVHTTTHLANLMTGSQCIDVRHFAGASMLTLAECTNTETINEVAIELLQSLELGENEYSKDVPYYLSRLIMVLNEQEEIEIIHMLERMMITGNDSVACITLDTVGEILKQLTLHTEKDRNFVQEQTKYLIGTILRGMTNEHEPVAREANYVLGEFLFGDKELVMDVKHHFFRYLGRKVYHILSEQRESSLSFMINAAALNHIYRFISEYILENGSLSVTTASKVAFFPGTFDPFSLGHKGIVKEIRNMGYEVYLAIDEFSWSKKTQPRLIRRKIAGMSTAADNGVFLFPDHIPVNLANPSNLAELRQLFADQELYIVVGSDVTVNASAYRKKPEKNSIHSFNHILFRRHGNDYDRAPSDTHYGITGDTVELTLPIHLEEVSSTRIRENIDLNRDISNLIDPTVQRFIYENNLYLREPQYKPILMTHPITGEFLPEISAEMWDELKILILRKDRTHHTLEELKSQNLQATILRDQTQNGKPVAVAFTRLITSQELVHEFNDLELTMKIREHVRGSILVIKAIYAPDDSEFHDYFQMVLTELLSRYVEQETDYCLYHGTLQMAERRIHVREVLELQGFKQLDSGSPDVTIMYASMLKPFVITANMETVIKAPFNTNPQVRKVLARCHKNFQRGIAALEPGRLTLSFDSAIMHYQLMNKITELNGVPNVDTIPRKLGDKMCVPFGKMLRGSITPNTVTKALHTEKVFAADMRSFTIEEYPNYSPLESQIRTIQAFRRDVILVEDILHLGDRLSILHQNFNRSDIHVSKIMSGIMTANGRDQVSHYGYSADCVYFIPDIRAWFIESSMYPFIGGDSVRTSGQTTAGLLTSVNLILPYVAPRFLMKYNTKAVYNMSMICLENAREILRVLEQEYQNTYQKNLTLNRLGEVVLSPTCPDRGRDMAYNANLHASTYIDNDISRLIRLKYVIREGE